MPRTIVLRDERGEYSMTAADDGTVRVGEGAAIDVRRVADGTLRVGRDPSRAAWTAVDGDARWVFFDGQVFRFDTSTGPTRRRTRGHHGTLAAPMPATVVSLRVAPGATVKRGETLIILEAMKMELPVRAPADGLVTGVNCRVGDLVQPGVSLIDLDTTAGDA
jgi:biotin carboxyl carrier protein